MEYKNQCQKKQGLHTGKSHFLKEQWFRSINVKWNFNWSHLSQMPFKGNILTFSSPFHFAVFHTAAYWGVTTHRAHIGCLHLPVSPCLLQHRALRSQEHSAPLLSPSIGHCVRESPFFLLSHDTTKWRCICHGKGKQCITNQMWIIINYNIIWQKGRKRTYSLRCYEGD